MRKWRSSICADFASLHEKIKEIREGENYVGSTTRFASLHKQIKEIREGENYVGSTTRFGGRCQFEWSIFFAPKKQRYGLHRLKRIG